MSSWYSDDPNDYYTTPDEDTVDLVSVSSQTVNLGLTPPQRFVWMTDAACTDIDPELFYGNVTLEVRRVCAKCPVLEACFRDTMRQALTVAPGEEHYGFVGGTTPLQRKTLVERLAA
jgi:hypothetical protein